MSALINGRMSYVECGDMRVVLAGLPAECFDSCVCDPPYELGFMGRAWDKSGVAFEPNTWAAAYRVLKPGAWLLAFGGTRTWHRIACAIEDAGFEMRDSIAWMYNTGMPKSVNLEKVTGDAAAHGLGTGIKPAHEPIIVARKPLIGTLAQNWKKHGTGGINIDGCRIEYSSAQDFEALAAGVDAIRERGGTMANTWKNASDLSGANPASPIDRWPANVVFAHAEGCKQVGKRVVNPNKKARSAEDSTVRRANVGNTPTNYRMQQGRQIGAESVSEWECVPGCPVAELDRQSGNRKGMTGGGKHRADYPGGMFGGIDSEGTARGDSGGASRFFFCTKTSSKERDAGLDHWPVLTGGEATDRADGSVGVNNGRAGAGRTGGRRNSHPTVKPITLMRWLVRLVTPPGGFVLDPFTGSGTTGCAAALEGFHFGGIELDPEHVRLALDRIAHWSKNAA